MAASPSEFCDKHFSGSVGLLPLPNFFLFPHVLQALHIFEPRYRQLLSDALDADHLIAAATFVDGWESQYEDAPPVHAEVCLGLITRHTMLQDGTSNILLVGVRRGRIVREQVSNRPYRVAEIELIPEVSCLEGAAADPECAEQTAGDCIENGMSPRRLQDVLQEELLAAYESLLPQSEFAVDPLIQIVGKESSLSLLTDLIGYSLKLPSSAKRRLLGESSALVRAQLLIDQIARLHRKNLECTPEERSDFPPDFSRN